MNKNARMWAEELPSYTQTIGTLQDKDGYCCLGVACAIYERETGNKLPVDDSNHYIGASLSKEFLPVRKWLGLAGPTGGYCSGDGLVNLAALNDDGAKFYEISKKILSEPHGLFMPDDE